MFIVPTFIYVLQLMRGILNLCDELNVWFSIDVSSFYYC